MSPVRAFAYFLLESARKPSQDSDNCTISWKVILHRLTICQMIFASLRARSKRPRNVSVRDVHTEVDSPPSHLATGSELLDLASRVLQQAAGEHEKLMGYSEQSPQSINPPYIALSAEYMTLRLALVRSRTSDLTENRY
jgi:hypothetical protein